VAVVSIKTSTPRPSVADLVSRAAEIAPFVRAQAEQTEKNRQVPAEAMARLREAGLFRVMKPAIYGGYEYGFDALIRVAAPIGAACGSTGWVFSLGIVHQWLAAMFPKQAQEEFWSDPDALLFGSYPPVGKVVPADGGYRLSGNWSFTSGCDHAQWLVLGGMIPPHGEGAPPTPAFFLLPIADVRLDDNWFTMGLAGTGSKNAVTDNVFVPAHRVVAVADLCAGTTPAPRSTKTRCIGTL
jgi:alkylation response protein AidB-like acyl-CoA dehydrogenase